MGDGEDLYGWYDPSLEEEPQTVRCKFCRKDGFEWGKRKGKWRLYTATGKIHECGKTKLLTGAMTDLGAQTNDR